jgi:O-antigen/teichoic acid export membrane protein
MIAKIKTLFNSDMKRNSAYSLLGNILFAILGFASIAILARTLSVKDYGIWIIYLTSSSLLEMMRLGFIHTALVKFIAGKSPEESNRYIGSSWFIGLSFTLVFSLLLFVLGLFVSEDNSYHLFLKYYPLLAFINLPQVLALGILQAKMDVKKQILVKFLSLFFSISVFVISAIFSLQINEVILLHLLANILASASILSFSGIKSIVLAKKSHITELLNFGKFSFGTLIGTNLLKSADTFILATALGSESAALYSIPLKLTETFEIILRSIINITLPKMAHFNNHNQVGEVRHIFQKFAGLLTLFYLPMMLFCFLFAEYILVFLAGERYLEMADVFRVFTIFGLFLPIDRFTGVTLDCLNLPKFNMIKVFVMVAVNVVLDIVILQFTSDLRFIAMGTILTTWVGIAFGIKFIRLKFETSFFSILRTGVTFWINFRYSFAKQ